MPIQPNVLRQLRKQKKNLKRAALAAASGISERTLTRLESPAGARTTPRDNTLERLAKALDVDQAVLTGEQAPPAATHVHDPDSARRVPVRAQLVPDARLGYELVKRRFGISQTALVNAAPLLFALLAEGSLRWREEKLQEVVDAADRLHRLGFGHLAFACAADPIHGGAASEEESIQQGDLFGRSVGVTAYNYGFDPSKNNPFADYLRDLARKIGDPDLISLGDELLGYGPLGEFPDFALYPAELERITGGSVKAMHALRLGDARLGDIPQSLWGDDATAERIQWLEERLSKELGELLDELPDLLVAPSTSDEKEAG